MRLLRKIEKALAPFAVPHTTEAIIIGQVLCYGLGQTQPQKIEEMALQWDAVMRGEWWRLATFLFVPPLTNPVFAFFGWYFFWMMGKALENLWGTLHYNFYLGVACIATVAVAWLTPDAPIANGYIALSVFLAFAFLYPNFEILLFFILPVKIKYLAMISWAGIFLSIVLGGLNTQLAAGASVLNFMLFFGKDVVRMVLTGRRRLDARMKQVVERGKAFHTCHTCGITDKTHPTMDFRYCPDCDGSPGYCRDHINNHTHVHAPVAKP